MDDDQPADPSSRPSKKPLESRTFRDGQIYLFRRQDYKKPTWFCRVKVPGAQGYISKSTRTTDEHAAYKFADDLYNRSLVKVISGHELAGKRVSAAIKEFTEILDAPLTKKLSIKYRIQFLKRISPFFGKLHLTEMTTSTLSDLFDWMRDHAKGKKMSPNTVKRYSTDLKQFFSWCQESGYLPDPPKFPKLRMDANRRPHFDHRD